MPELQVGKVYVIRFKKDAMGTTYEVKGLFWLDGVRMVRLQATRKGEYKPIVRRFDDIAHVRQASKQHA
jgi:hypothetical protein